MQRTPLYDGHVAAGAKLVDFAGWEMPIHYSGVVDECQAVRSAAGLFDVSHMGRVAVSGPNALAFLQRVTTNDVAALAPRGSHYSMVCNPQGGIKDDVYVYRPAADRYLVCVNASNRAKLVAWFAEQAKAQGGVTVEDKSAVQAQLALQGQAAKSILAELAVPGLADLAPRQCLDTALLGIPLLLARTGYTGEPGYELYLPADRALPIWTELLARGKGVGLKPVGLGARDLLRLEMAYLLYGNDMSEEVTPLEAGADWIVNFEKGDFIGRAALERQQAAGLPRKLAAFELLDKAVPRHGCKVLAEGRVIGEVTSGNLSPLLQKGIGLASVPPDKAVVGTALAVDIRGRIVPAVVVKPPFYRRKKAA